jgi:GNAT superfamily N-acetyltransferase
VAGFPEHFTPDVPGTVRDGIRTHKSWVATEGETIVGFAVVVRRRPAVAEIRWAATSAARRGKGIGTMRVERVLDDLRRDGVRLVEVETLDPIADYQPYQGTYAFWIARGFVHVDTIDPLPGWDPGNPFAFLFAALEPTHPGPTNRPRT